jgi:hypothetical protein
LNELAEFRLIVISLVISCAIHYCSSSQYRIQGVSFKTQSNNNHVPRNKDEIKAGLPPCNRLSQRTSHVTLESRSPWLLRRCSRQLSKNCADANMVYSRAEHLFILEHYFATKSCVAVREAFSNECPEKEVPNKTTIHRLVTTFRDTGSAHRATNQLKLRPCRFQAVYQLQQRDTAARIQYCHWFRRFVREGVHV